MVSRRIVGSIHSKKPKFGEMELDFEEADGQNWQCRQELLELKAEEENWLYVTRSKSALWT